MKRQGLALSDLLGIGRTLPWSLILPATIVLFPGCQIEPWRPTLWVIGRLGITTIHAEYQEYVFLNPPPPSRIEEDSVGEWALELCRKLEARSAEAGPIMDTSPDPSFGDGASLAEVTLDYDPPRVRELRRMRYENGSEGARHAYWSDGETVAEAKAGRETDSDASVSVFQPGEGPAKYGMEAFVAQWNRILWAPYPHYAFDGEDFAQLSAREKSGTLTVILSVLGKNGASTGETMVFQSLQSQRFVVPFYKRVSPQGRVVEIRICRDFHLSDENLPPFPKVMIEWKPEKVIVYKFTGVNLNSPIPDGVFDAGNWE